METPHPSNVSPSPCLFHDVFSKTSTKTERALAIQSLSRFMEKDGPFSMAISQGWLALILIEIMSSKTKIEEWKIGLINRSVKRLVAAVVANALGAIASPHSLDCSPLPGLLCREPFTSALRLLKKKKASTLNSEAFSMLIVDGIKALIKSCANDFSQRKTATEFGTLNLLKYFLSYPKLGDEYGDAEEFFFIKPSTTAMTHFPHMRKIVRLLSILSPLKTVQTEINSDRDLRNRLREYAEGLVSHCKDPKIQSYARATLINICRDFEKNVGPCFNDDIFIINPELPHWKHIGLQMCESPQLDIVFVHGLQGGPYKSWRIADDETTNEVAHNHHRTMLRKFWPCEWLSSDIPEARVFTVKYKTKLTNSVEPSLPLEDISSKLLKVLINAGIGDRPLIFITHSMGGLVVKQMLYEAKEKKIDNFLNKTVGIAFYGCPHLGNKLAKFAWTMRAILHTSPTLGDLRSGSSRLTKLNDFLRGRFQEGKLEVLSFCETKRTPIIKSWKKCPVGKQIVSRKSADPGFGEVVELKSSNHINMCKPLSRTDPSYQKTLEFLKKLREEYS